MTADITRRGLIKLSGAMAVLAQLPVAASMLSLEEEVAAVAGLAIPMAVPFAVGPTPDEWEYPTPAPTATPTAPATASPTLTATQAPTETPTATATATETVTPTQTSTATPEPTETPPKVFEYFFPWIGKE